jgi:hypothetical protein
VESNGRFITDWWLIGPFDNMERKGFAMAYPPEKSFDTTQAYGGKNGQKLNWKRYSDKTSGYIDLARLHSPTDNVVSYAYTKISLPEAQTLQFGVGSNDGVRVWINGRLVLDRLVSRKAVPNEDLVNVDMQKGENIILVKVDQTGDRWGFYFTQNK